MSDADIDVGLDDDPMPVFVIKAKDLLAVDALRFYIDECHRRGLHGQASQVVLAHAEMAGWRQRHPELVKDPDHRHVPVKGRP